jgi:acetate kinase
LSSFEEVDAIGHRIVHGGKKYLEPVLIDNEVKNHIKSLSDLAPLHNLEDLEGIEIVEKFFKKKPQIAVFDTSFHRTLPKSAAYYPIPYHYIEEGIQRYGFHGINYQYCTRRVAQLLNQDINPLKILICHLGSGASLCAVKDGKSIDTTMGFTPLEGLMMDTRSGTIDPGVILYLLKKKKGDEISQELYYKSGLLGISGDSSDMRDIIEKASGNPRCKLALEIYLHRLCSCIGSMIASLQGLDVLVFTAGIGENSPEIRKKVCEHFSFLGIKLDEKKNSQELKQDCELSTSKIKVLVIHAGEAFEIARESMKKLS